MSDDPDQEHFADGMSEDLITGPVPHPLAVRHRAQLDICLQEPRGRRETGRSGTWRALRAGRQRAPRRQANSHQRAAYRCDHRRPPLGGTLRPRARRYLRRAGRDHPQCRCGDRTAPAGGRGDSRALAIAGRPWRLGTGGARANACLAPDARRLRQRRSRAWNRRSKPIRNMHPPEAGWRSDCCFQRIWAGSIASMDWSLAASTPFAPLNWMTPIYGARPRSAIWE